MTAVVERSAPVLELDNPTGPRPRPAERASKEEAEIVPIAPNVWAVCVFALIPKNGFGHLDFPHYWGRLDEGSIWRVARHGEVPDGTFVFTNEAEARAALAEAYGSETCLRPFMGRISIPSDDHRVKTSGSRAPRRARRTTEPSASGGVAPDPLEVER